MNTFALLWEVVLHFKSGYFEGQDIFDHFEERWSLFGGVESRVRTTAWYVYHRSQIGAMF